MLSRAVQMRPASADDEKRKLDPGRAVPVQVWNVNRYSGIVGAFHLQGAAWSRTRRQFLVHDETPPPLATQVCCHPCQCSACHNIVRVVLHIVDCQSAALCKRT